MSHLRLFAATLFAFLTLDAAWIVLVGNPFFQSEVGPLLRAQPNLVAAAFFYLIYTGGLVVLAAAPAVRERSAKAAVWRGAALGLTAYATFDLTNLSILKGWTPAVTFVDMAWGTAASSVASLAGYHVACIFSPARQSGERSDGRPDEPRQEQVR